jgi:hypothetical protein
MEANIERTQPRVADYARVVAGTWGQCALLIALALVPIQFVAAILIVGAERPLPIVFAVAFGLPMYLLAALFGTVQILVIDALRRAGQSPGHILRTIIGSLPVFTSAAVYRTVSGDLGFIELPAWLFFGITTFVAAWRLSRRIDTQSSSSRASYALSAIALGLLFAFASFIVYGEHQKREWLSAEVVKLRNSPEAQAIKDSTLIHRGFGRSGPMSAVRNFNLYLVSKAPMTVIEARLIASGYKKSGDRLSRNTALTRFSPFLKVNGQTVYRDGQVPGPGAEGQCYMPAYASDSSRGYWTVCVYETLESNARYTIEGEVIDGTIIFVHVMD